MRAPPPAVRSRGKAAIRPCTTPSRFTLMMRWNSSGVVSAKGAWNATPAVCTHVSNLPNSFTAPSATASTAP